MQQSQRGGTFLGFVVGVVVGLGLALAVAVYVMRVPVPFVDRGVVRKAEPESAPKPDWNPNAPLAGRAGSITPAPAASGATAADTPAPTPTPTPALPSASATAPARPASSATGGDAAARRSREPASAPAPAADPLGELARERSAAVDPFAYFVQVGAFRTPEEAEAQRAKLGLQGVEAKVSEREQAGRVVYRVRVGPLDNRDAAEKTKQRLEASGFEAAIVRVQR